MKVQQGIFQFPLEWEKVIIAKQLGITFQLYFDFSGYCDMAEGIALVLVFSLPRNFGSLYKAVTISEFWKKWHTSLTRFFTVYVYIPLVGGINGTMKCSVNIMIVYLVSGFWHGTSLTFILWGMMHAFLMIMDKLT